MFIDFLVNFILNIFIDYKISKLFFFIVYVVYVLSLISYK